MLEFCRAIIVAPNAFDSQALCQVAEEVGFGDVVSIFNEGDSNGLSYPVSYFLVHHRLADADCEDVVYGVRRIERNGLRYSPMVLMISDAPSEVALKYVRMGFDDVLSLPQSQIQVADRLETQLDREILYLETADYLGPDRRRLDPYGALHRPVGITAHTQLLIRRDPDFGNRVLSRQLRGKQHVHAAPVATPAEPAGSGPERTRSFGKRLQPPVPSAT